MVDWFNSNLALIIGVVFFVVLIQVSQASGSLSITYVKPYAVQIYANKLQRLNVMFSLLKPFDNHKIYKKNFAT